VDNSGNGVPEARFGPDRRFTGGAAAGFVAAALVAAFTTDPAGRLLAAIAAVLLAGYVVSDLVFTPRVTASGRGIVVRSPMLRTQLDWATVDDVRADQRIRLGLRSTTLEIDAGPVLAVLSRRAIGADPQAAADLILAFRPPG
jgi:predicted acyltransferase